jgi:hypothetical protein
VPHGRLWPIDHGRPAAAESSALLRSCLPPEQFLSLGGIMLVASYSTVTVPLLLRYFWEIDAQQASLGMFLLKNVARPDAGANGESLAFEEPIRAFHHGADRPVFRGGISLNRMGDVGKRGYGSVFHEFQEGRQVASARSPFPGQISQ